MSKFLSGGNQDLTDGTAELNIRSATLQSLVPNLPVRTTGGLQLTSGLIGLSDLSFSPLISPFPGTLQAENFITQYNTSPINLNNYIIANNIDISALQADVVTIDGEITTLQTDTQFITASGSTTTISCTNIDVIGTNFLWNGQQVATVGAPGAYLPLAGGTMSGSINMGTNNISNIGQLAATSDIIIGTANNAADVVIGPSPTSTVGGSNSVAIGGGRTLGSNKQIAIGEGAHTNNTGSYNIAIGRQCFANGNADVCIGQSSQTAASGAIAIGSTITCSGVNSVAIGTFAGCDGTGSGQVAIGHDAAVIGNGIAIGDSAGSSGGNSIAIGSSADATGLNGVALGKTSLASGSGSTAIGNSAIATVSNAISIGTSATASENACVAIGLNSVCDGSDSGIAIGQSASIGSGTGTNNIAIGLSASVSGGTVSNAIAIGNAAANTISNSILLGDSAISSIRPNSSICSLGTSGSPFAGLTVAANTGIDSTGALNVGTITAASVAIGQSSTQTTINGFLNVPLIPYGSVYDVTGFAVSLSPATGALGISTASATGLINSTFSSPSAGVLRYIGASRTVVNVDVDVTFETNTSSTITPFLSINNSTSISSTQTQAAVTVTSVVTPLHVHFSDMIAMSPNDTIRLAILSTSAASLTFFRVSIKAAASPIHI